MKSFVFKLLLILHLLPKKYVIDIFENAIKYLNNIHQPGMCEAIRYAIYNKYNIGISIRHIEYLFKHYGFTRNNFIKYCSYYRDNDDLNAALYYKRNYYLIWTSLNETKIRIEFLEYLINKLSKI